MVQTEEPKDYYRGLNTKKRFFYARGPPTTHIFSIISLIRLKVYVYRMHIHFYAYIQNMYLYIHIMYLYIYMNELFD